MNDFIGLLKKAVNKYKLICLESENKELFYFYLSKGSYKTFLKQTLNKSNIYVSLSYNEEESKTFSNFKAYKCTALNKIDIKEKGSFETIYINESSNEYINNIIDYKGYKVFMDYEFTMGQRNQKNFESEIIQAGIIVSDESDKIVYEYSNYIMTKNKVTERCKRFLDLDDDILKESITQKQFYKDFSEIINIYKPICFTWGGSDNTELSHFFKYNKLKPIEFRSIDLSELIKKYYHLPENIGLFRALKIFNGIKAIQSHHALTDTACTKDIFDSFKKDVKSETHIDVLDKLIKIKEEDKEARKQKKLLRQAKENNESNLKE